MKWRETKVKEKAIMANLDKAYCAERDCRHYDDCERRIPDDVPDDVMLWQMEKCEDFKKKEPEK